MRTVILCPSLEEILCALLCALLVTKTSNTFDILSVESCSDESDTNVHDSTLKLNTVLPSEFGLHSPNVDSRKYDSAQKKNQSTQSYGQSNKSNSKFNGNNRSYRTANSKRAATSQKGTTDQPSKLVFRLDSFANIEQLIKLIDDENKEFYMLGDLNANMFDVSNNATKNLNSIIELYQLTQTISSPTRVTMTTSTLLDVCLTPTPDKLVLSKVVQIAISDHYMILVVRKINIRPKQNNRHKKVEIRSFKYFNAENFLMDLSNQEWELLDNNFCVDRMWETWKIIFLSVLDKHAPIREKRVKNIPNLIPWLTNAIKKQMRERDRLKFLAVKYNSENYWTAYKTSRNHITSTLREAKTAYYKAQFESVKHDPKKAWKTVNKILNRKQECREINCIHTQNGQISCPNELAERFNNYFTDIGPKIATTIGNTDRNFTDYITKTTSSFKFQTVSETNVYKLLSSLNPCKSTGIDKIPVKIIRIAAPIIANSLTRIFNTAIYSETVPSEWKLARVIPLHKNCHNHW